MQHQAFNCQASTSSKSHIYGVSPTGFTCHPNMPGVGLYARTPTKGPQHL